MKQEEVIERLKEELNFFNGTLEERTILKQIINKSRKS